MAPVPCPPRLLPAALAGLALLGHGALAEQSLTFQMNQRFEANDNLGLDPVSLGRTLRSDTTLAFEYLSETRTQSLSFGGSGIYRISDGPGGDVSEFTNPNLNLAYSLAGGNAAFEVSASYAWADVAFIRPLSDFFDPETGFNPPSDLEDLTGEGTRINRTLSTQLTFGVEGPFGVTVSARASDLTYRDTTDPGLVDERRYGAGLSFRMDLNDVTSASLGYDYSVLEQDGEADRETHGVNLAVTLVRPNGDLRFTLSATDAEGDERQSLRFTRALELPNASLSFGLGASRDEDGEISVTGDLGYAQELPRGQLTANLQRQVTPDDGDGGAVVTSLSLGLSHVLNDTTSFGFDLSYVDNSALGSGTDLQTGSVGLSVTRALTPDWSATLGYRYSIREEEGLERAEDNSVFLTIGRSFDFRL